MIITAAVFKFIVYFTPETINDEADVKSVSEVQLDSDALYMMPFNSDLTVAGQEVLFASSDSKTAQFDFVSFQNNKVLVRAEIFVDKDTLDSDPIKKLFHNIIYPNDNSLVRIGKTGWIHPGELATDMKFDELPSHSCQVKIRYTAINPLNKKVNAGTFDYNTMLYIVDFKGNLLDENGNWVKAE